MALADNSGSTQAQGVHVGGHILKLGKAPIHRCPWPSCDDELHEPHELAQHFTSFHKVRLTKVAQKSAAAPPVAPDLSNLMKVTSKNSVKRVKASPS